MAETPYKPRKTLMTPEEINKLKGKNKGKNTQKQKSYYKPRKTLMTPAEINNVQVKKPEQKNKQVQTPQTQSPQIKNPPTQNKITKPPAPASPVSPTIKPKTQENKPFEKVSKPELKNKSENIAGGYSKRITYPKEELKPLEEPGGFQKGSGKIGGYVKPKTISYNSTKGVIWALLIIFVVAVAFGVLYFTNSLNNLKIGGIGLKSQDLEMKISNVQIENDSLDLTLDIDPNGEDLVGVKILVDDGVNFDVFKVELTKEEIEKGEIHIDLEKVNGEKITKILISPITNTEERQGVVGSVKESYIPKRTDFVNQRDLNNYEPKDIYYPYNDSQLSDQSNQTTTNNTQLQNQTTNQTQVQNQTTNQTQENNETNTQENQTQNPLDYSYCTDNNISICYHEAVYQFNTCTRYWELKQDCNSKEVCITNQCVLKEDVVPACGNGILEVGEYCEVGNLAGETCESFGYTSGTLICNPKCAFDLSMCLEPEESGTEPDCTANQTYSCYDGNVYWYDSCDELGIIKESCEDGCENNACIENTCDPLPNACENKECGSDGCSDNGCGTCPQEEECNSNGECVPELINSPCWFIENNECFAGNDEVSCDKDIIYPNAEACEQELLPSECFPLQTNTYHCTLIEETSPGYTAIVQGEDTCGPCLEEGTGEVIQQGEDYYCKCPVSSDIR